MNCIIIEDEAVAARRLSKLIERQNVEVLDILHSVQEAIAWFEQNDAPDLIFLDIQLGDGLSFEIFEHVQPKSAIIFTTAYDDYALRAFKLNSIDYLLKPIKETELIVALEKFRQNQQQQIEISSLQLQELLQTNFEKKYKERFLIKVGQKLVTVETDEAEVFYSENKGTYLKTRNKNFLLDSSLDQLEEILNPNKFFRVSRQAIVNIDFCQEIIAYSGSRLQIKINNESWLVSRERVNDFKAWLER